MGWKLEVPEGWTRGEPIHFFGSGPRYGCARDHTAHPVGALDVSKESYIVFDTKAEAEAFRDWWGSHPKPSEGQS